ncbi:tetratricopeptide repeat protein [Alphaproteobacteria bacterium LSUCC0396]
MSLAFKNQNIQLSEQKQKIQLLLEAAVERHQNGNLAAANMIYEKIRKIDPDNVVALQLSGVLACQVQQYEASLSLFSRAIYLKPDYAEAYNNRGITFKNMGQFDDALANYSKAVSLKPNYVDALYNCGIALQQLNRLDEAIVSYSKAISIRPNYVEALNNRGNIFKDLDRLDEALADLSKAVELKPNDAEALNNRGVILQGQKLFNKALVDYNRALELQPDFAAALNNRGIAFQELGMLDEALGDFNKAITLEANIAENFNNRANILRELGRLDEAIADLNKAIALDPDYLDALNNRALIFKETNRLDETLADLDKAIILDPIATKTLNNRGVILNELGRFDEAMADHDKAISLQPDYAEAFNNRALVLKELGRFGEAMADLNKAIALYPDYPEAHWNKALQLLLFGEFEEGWPLCEWRWKTKQQIGTELTTSKPRWSGEANKRVFLWAEQGIGDEIMYASLIPELAATSSKLIVQCDERLIPLFKRSFVDGIEYRCRKSPALEDSYDCHIPMGSLPNIFRPSLDSFSKASKAYLRCESERSQELRKTLLKGEAKTLIGISWNSSSPIAGAHHRNITLSDMAQHLDGPNVKLVNLQYGDVSDEIAKLREDHGIEVAEVSEIDNRNDIDGLAALIMACDQIVSIDNATVHLAGALGANTRVLLPFNRSWQWGLERSDSYWYGSLQLHRQKKPGDWKPTLKTIK